MVTLALEDDRRLLRRRVLQERRARKLLSQLERARSTKRVQQLQARIERLIGS